jgi:hypothetical protein
MGYLSANLATLVASFVVRFAILDRVIYVPQPTRRSDEHVVLAA